MLSTLADPPKGLDAIGPSKEFMDTVLRQHSVTPEDVAALVAKGHEAIRNSNEAKIQRIAEIGSSIIGQLKGVLL